MAKITVGTENQTPVELYYEDHGEGEPIVLIHGWPLSGRSWEYQVPALVEAGYRVITYDRRGFGNSSQPWNGYDYDTLSADLHQLMEHLDLRNATLVGFSMGGGEVARYIGAYGTERVKKAVFAAAVPPYMYKAEDNPEGALDAAGVEDMKNGVKKDRIDFLDGFTKNFFGVDGETLVSEPLRLYMRDIAAAASPKGTIDCIVAFGKTDFREDLKKIDVPTLVIHGNADSIVPMEASGKRTHESVSGSQLSVIDGGPHGLNVTHAEEFNEALLAFLKE